MKWRGEIWYIQNTKLSGHEKYINGKNLDLRRIIKACRYYKNPNSIMKSIIRLSL